MNTLLTGTAASAALWVVIKGSLLMSIAAVLQFTVLRRASASTRHTAWTLSLVAILLLPIASASLPPWSLVIPAAASPAQASPKGAHISEPPAVVSGNTSAATATTMAPTPDVPARQIVTLRSALVGVYMAGVLLIAALVTLHHWTLARLVRRAPAVAEAEWTRLFAECAARAGIGWTVRFQRSREGNVPMAFGTRRPAIVIPAIADAWDDDRRRAVLLHELAHVARHDCFTDRLALAACAMYWFHPAVWWIARQVRIERELACDDRVIAAGTEPRAYAGHLLEIAYSFGPDQAPALAVSMARPRQLEGRMLAALDTARNRTAPALRTRLAGAGAALVLLAVVAVARPISAAAVTGEVPGETVLEQWSTLPDKTALKAGLASPAQQETDSVTLHELAPRTLDAWKAAGVNVARAAAAAVLDTMQEATPGTWEIRPADTKDTVHLRIVERNSSSGTNVPIGQLEGLTSAQLTGAGGPVQFRVRRDAGTFTFEGAIRNGVGAGTFSFAPDAGFPAELAKRGFDRPNASEQYQMARFDIGFGFLDELNAQGYAKPQTAELVRAGQHGVQATYVREMGALGYRLGSLDPLITLRDHGITPAYVRQLADQGYKGLSADDLRQARDHGITPEYVQGMRDGGYGSVEMKQLITVRDHGVTPDFVRALQEAGYNKLPLDQVVRARDHGVSPEYISGIRKLGYSLPIDGLVNARDHGVTLEYVRDMAELGYGNEPMDALVRLRDHGVTPGYAQELKALGYDKLALDDLVTLRDHGLTPDRVRAANARAGTRLPVDMLKSLADGGR
jgi:beta-lactamase regulating signal transducer with metallopeptidase domain